MAVLNGGSVAIACMWERSRDKNFNMKNYCQSNIDIGRLLLIDIQCFVALMMSVSQLIEAELNT